MLKNVMTMKRSTYCNCWLLTAGAALALFTFTAKAGDEPKKHGKGILHLDIHQRMANEGILAAASGKADVQLHKEGDKDSHEKVKLHLKGLDVGVTYQIAALLNEDTNLIQVATFTPDHEGKAEVELREKGPKHSESKDGHVKAQLPSELRPVTLISELLVIDANGAAILTADLSNPQKFEYLAKRDLSDGDIRAKLEIKANHNKARVRLDAKGLEPDAEYSLALNGNVAGSNTANSEGKVDLRAELLNPADVLTLSSVALLDSGTNTVLSATLP
jgi:hypothetical protein